MEEYCRNVYLNKVLLTRERKNNIYSCDVNNTIALLTLLMSVQVCSAVTNSVTCHITMFEQLLNIHIRNWILTYFITFVNVLTFNAPKSLQEAINFFIVLIHY